ncbi:MAG TPA: metallophosphoesterase [Pseudomonadales bacterium]|nr:metallophosphoesterase [Pseudomonadales bacterium]
MRIFAASDLHFEFHNAIDWLPPLPEADAFDVMVLAGDVGTSAYLGAALRRLRYKFPDKPIILVVGNHEHFGKNINRDVMSRIDVPDVHFLENGRVDLQGYHFLGTTLWTGFDCLGEKNTKKAMEMAWKHIADFISIRTAELSETNGVHRYITAEEMADLYQKARAWLIAELQTVDPEKTIVVTHFPPSREYRHGQIPEDLIGAYFQANCMDIIKQYQPALWIYGHNHFSNTHTCGKTKIVSNQYGYPSESTGYRGDLIINVSGIPSLGQMLADSDPTAPRSPESEAWINGSPAGKEKL